MSNVVPATLHNPGEDNLPIAWPAVKRGHPRRTTGARRRPTRQQGRALELLGHAVEYLVDSRLYLCGGLSHPSDELAVQLLMKLNREVFAECAQIVPFRSRLRRWLRW